MNDNPEVTTSLAWSLIENGNLTINSNLLLVEDDDQADGPSEIVFTLDSLPPSPTGETDPAKLAGLYIRDVVSGELTRLSIGGTFTQQDIFDGLVVYQQNGQESNVPFTDDRVQLTAIDSAGGSTGPITIDVTITGINDSPQVINSEIWSLSENDTLPITSTLLLVEDNDLADDPSEIVFTLDSLPPSPTGETDPSMLAGIYREDTLSGTFVRLSTGDTFTQQDILDGLVEYRQNGQESNTVATDDRVQLTANDSAGSTTGTIAIDVAITDENDSPQVINSLAWSLSENDALPISSSLLLVEDEDLVDDPSEIVFTLDNLPLNPTGETDPTRLAGLYREDAISGLSLIHI